MLSINEVFKDFTNTYCTPIETCFTPEQLKSVGLSENRTLIVTTKYAGYRGGFACLAGFDRKGTPVNITVPTDGLVKPASEEIVNEVRSIILKNGVSNYFYYQGMVGSDPEIFVKNEQGQTMNAFDFLPSKEETKLKPEIAYWDGVQAEFSTQAITCLAYHVDSIQRGLAQTLAAARKKDNKATLSLDTVVDVSPEVLQNAKEEHITFGCMPSFNAYGMSGASIPPRLMPFRSAGGHMHFGIGKITEEMANQVVKALDAIIGVACVSMFANVDDPRRRMLYGLAGEYRLPKHGIEYRVLSNAWLSHPTLAHLMFDLSRKVIALGYSGLLNDVWETTEQETIECINTCNVEKAREILKRPKNEAFFKSIVKWAYQYEGNSFQDTVFNAFLNGMESIIANPKDIEGNWELTSGEWVGHSDGKDKNATRLIRSANQKNKKAA